jgi:hypothetical protein
VIRVGWRGSRLTHCAGEEGRGTHAGGPTLVWVCQRSAEWRDRWALLGGKVAFRLLELGREIDPETVWK